MVYSLEVMGIGEISWTFASIDSTLLHFVNDRYYVPQGKARLLSPQRIFNKKTKDFGLLLR